MDGDLPERTFKSFLGVYCWEARLGDEAPVDVDTSRPSDQRVLGGILHSRLQRRIRIQPTEQISYI